ncbi:MAG: hypothetical protein ACLU4J_15005 [Butyricimonas paravirosa]
MNSAQRVKLSKEMIEGNPVTQLSGWNRVRGRLHENDQQEISAEFNEEVSGWRKQIPTGSRHWVERHQPELPRQFQLGKGRDGLLFLFRV